MKRTVFMGLLDVYGADIARWPAEHQDGAARFLADSAEAQQDVLQSAAIDRMLTDCAPTIELARSDRLALAVIRGVERSAAVAHPIHWIVRWGLDRRVVYASMFVLGCASNFLLRALSAEAPVDLLFSSNLLIPFGG